MTDLKPNSVEGRLSARPWRKGDPLPEIGSQALVSGANADIESDQHRGYMRRTVIGYGEGDNFIVLQTSGCWPTVERTTNCWFAEIDTPRANHPTAVDAALGGDIECSRCLGTGKIVEEARTHGANQHSACQMDCEDCDGSGRIREESTAEHIARDMRDGIFPARSEPKMVPAALGGGERSECTPIAWARSATLTRLRETSLGCETANLWKSQPTLDHVPLFAAPPRNPTNDRYPARKDHDTHGRASLTPSRRGREVHSVGLEYGPL